MSLPKHGTVRRYKTGCRCDDCKAANTEASRRYRSNRRRREGRPEPARQPLSPADLRDEPIPSPPRARTEPSQSDIDRELERLLTREISGPIEREARALLDTYDRDAVTRLRREVVFGAARIMDDRSKASLFRNAAQVVRDFVADILASTNAGDGEADALRDFLASLGGSRGRGNGAALDDATSPRP